MSTLPIFKLVHVSNNTSAEKNNDNNNNNNNNNSNNNNNNNLDITFDPSQVITIGRDVGKATLLLPQDQTDFSRTHCKIAAVGRDVRIQDLSKYGTFVNGKKLGNHVVKSLHSGDRISLCCPAHEQENFYWTFYSSLDGGITLVDEEETETTQSIRIHTDPKERMKNVRLLHEREVERTSREEMQREQLEEEAEAQAIQDAAVEAALAREKKLQEDYRQQELDNCPNEAAKLSTQMRHAKMGDAFAIYEADRLRAIYDKINHGGPGSQSNNNYNNNNTMSMNAVRDHYVVLDSVGKGGSARVIRGYRKSDHVPVAIKIIEKAKFSHRGSSAALQLDFDRMKEEGNILRELDHPNIVKVYDVFDEKEIFAIVMECASHGDLRSLVSGRSSYFSRMTGPSRLIFTEDELRSLFLQLFKALAHLQSRNIVHLDIKLENILVHIPEEYMVQLYESDPSLRDETRKAKLAASIDVSKITLKISDFGLAELCEDGKKLTRHVGTQRYVAPEVDAIANKATPLHQHGYTNAVDIYSLGVVLHVMVSDHFPSKVLTEISINEPDPDDPYGIKEVPNTEPKIIRQFEMRAMEGFHLSVSCELKDLMNKMLQITPDKRIGIPGIGRHAWLKGTDADEVAREFRLSVAASKQVPLTQQQNNNPDAGRMTHMSCQPSNDHAQVNSVFASPFFLNCNYNPRLLRMTNVDNNNDASSIDDGDSTTSSTSSSPVLSDSSDIFDEDLYGHMPNAELYDLLLDEEEKKKMRVEYFSKLDNPVIDDDDDDDDDLRSSMAEPAYRWRRKTVDAEQKADHIEETEEVVANDTDNNNNDLDDADNYSDNDEEQEAEEEEDDDDDHVQNNNNADPTSYLTLQETTVGDDDDDDDEEEREIEKRYGLPSKKHRPDESEDNDDDDDTNQ